jgi:hypothetical protein
MDNEIKIEIPGFAILIQRINRIEERQKEIIGLLQEKSPVKNWLTETEAQEYTGYSRNSLYALRRSGKILGKNGVGKNRYFRPSLDKYMGRKDGL